MDVDSRSIELFNIHLRSTCLEQSARAALFKKRRKNNHSPSSSADDDKERALTVGECHRIGVFGCFPQLMACSRRSG